MSNTATTALFVDVVKMWAKKLKIAAISHAGWRGTAQKIGVKTVEKTNLKICKKQFGNFINIKGILNKI